jgi:hypothetical protein
MVNRQMDHSDSLQGQTRVRFKQYLEGSKEAHSDLDAAALAVGNLVHAPGEVDVQQLDESRPSSGVHVSNCSRERKGELGACIVDCRCCRKLAAKQSDCVATTGMV